MSENKKIYVVTQGSYSDYRIVAVYSDEEMANERAAQEYDATVEGYDLNPPLDHELGTRGYKVVMSKDGSSRVDIVGVYSGEDAWYAANGNRAIDAIFYISFKGDKNQAIKIANERRIMLIASGEWDKAESERVQCKAYYDNMPRVWDKVRE